MPVCYTVRPRLNPLASQLLRCHSTEEGSNQPAQHGVQGVGGSNPLAPTISIFEPPLGLQRFSRFRGVRGTRFFEGQLTLKRRSGHASEEESHPQALSPQGD